MNVSIEKAAVVLMGFVCFNVTYAFPLQLSILSLPSSAVIRCGGVSLLVFSNIWFCVLLVSVLVSFLSSDLVESLVSAIALGFFCHLCLEFTD